MLCSPPLLLLLMLMTLLVVTGSDRGTDCRLDRPDQLRTCVQEALDRFRPRLAARFDPLRLPDQSGSGADHHWWLSNIRVEGASGIHVRRAEVRPTGNNKLLIVLSVFWPRIGAKMNAKARVCRRVFVFYPCLTVEARPEIVLVAASATLSTTWRASVTAGQLTIVPSDTKLSIRLDRISVKPRFKGFAGFVYGLLGNIARDFVNKKVREEWQKQRPNVERRLAKNIEEVINKHVGPALSRVLKGQVPL